MTQLKKVAKNIIRKILLRFDFHISRTEASHELGFIKRIQTNLFENSNYILHIGASEGQEASFYSQFGKTVIWIEAIPSIFEELKINCSKFQNQVAICALLGDRNLESTPFFIASNKSESSSLYTFSKDRMGHGVEMKETVYLPMKRLDSIPELSNLPPKGHWVIDVQGAELLVLRGAESLLNRCSSLLIEVSTVELYRGGAKWNEVKEFLDTRGFSPLWTPKEESHENVLFVNVRAFD
jgi:FkbM family methyltransferase